MIDASWSHYDGEECIRLSGSAHGEKVQVRPRAADDVVGRFPPMAGRTTREGRDLCFLPRFAFMDGTAYEVSMNGGTTVVLFRPERSTRATTEVLSLHPSAHEVPRNFLRAYVVFSNPMSEGYAAEHLRLLDESGETMYGALLSTDYELWDSDHRRLTALLDPARIKRGLVSHRQAGYPVRIGQPFRLVVDEGFRDAGGAPLRAGAEKRYEVGADERGRVDPASWTIRAPRRDTLDPLEVTFHRPLDYGLLLRCLHVADPAGQRVDGVVELGSAETSWRLVPSTPWHTGPHQLVVDDLLEDVAGNSVRRVFDRDQTRTSDAVREHGPPVIRYFPR